jgi:hypothetical protein
MRGLDNKGVQTAFEAAAGEKRHFQVSQGDRSFFGFFGNRAWLGEMASVKF